VETLRFFSPVRLVVDDGVVEFETVDEAIAFLMRWPRSRRGPVYDCAMRGLDTCRQGRFAVEDARRSFESFARITGILAGGGPILSVTGRQAQVRTVATSALRRPPIS
jgi:hypothetical protein